MTSVERAFFVEITTDKIPLFEEMRFQILNLFFNFGFFGCVQVAARKLLMKFVDLGEFFFIAWRGSDASGGSHKAR